MIRHWESISSNKTMQKALELAGGISVMLIAGVFSPTYWLMTMVLKPYFDLRAVFSASNALSGYLHLIHTMKALGPQVLLLQIVPLLCLCLLVGLGYSAACTWIGVRLTKYFIQSNDPQTA